MNLKKFGLVALSMGAIFCASCQGSKYISFEKAVAFAKENYDPKEKKEWEYKSFDAEWDFNATTGDEYKAKVLALLQKELDKDIKDLNLIECAQLAALPQSPATYAPLKRIAVSDVKDMDSLDIITKDDNIRIICIVKKIFQENWKTLVMHRLEKSACITF